MWIQQVFVACLSVLLGLQQITAVVNNGQKANDLLNSNTTNAVNNTTSENNSENNNNVSGVSDSLAESSELTRREAPLGLSTTYGLPLATNTLGLIQDTYIPQLPSNIGLPTPIYGVPDAPTNNIVYPAPPPDIHPPIQAPLTIYGPPKDHYGPPALSLPPPKYGPPPIFNRPLKPSFNIPKPIYGPPSFGPPKPQYGPPSKPLFIPSKIPKPTYGLPIKLPKPHYGPPKHLYVPPKPLNTYGPPEGYFNGLKNLYGPPKTVYAPSKGVYIPSPAPAIQYGPPEPIPHGPPHPGAPAPPTPPDIKYDGWQPIPGLVSRPPSGSYGVPNIPKGQPHGFNDLQFNTDFLPPPSGGHGHGHGISISGISSIKGSYKGSSGVSDSYGAPLNTVTGSGGIVTTSGDTLHSNLDVGGHASHDGNGLSVIKSIGYEIVPNGLYAAAHSYNTNPFPVITPIEEFNSQLASTFEATLPAPAIGGGFNHDLSSNIGLIPPSGVYGVPPSGKYGTPLLHPPNRFNSFGINRPKHPVSFREPVPSGLIESIGHSVAQKDAAGIIESVHANNFGGPAYVPPPVPDVGNVKPVREEQPPEPSTLFSLPNKNPISFQTYVHGSPTAGLNADFSSSLNIHGASAAALTSYNAPLASGGDLLGLTSQQGIQDSFGVSGGGFATNNFVAPSLPLFSSYQNVGHDCSQKSQPVPSLSFGVPSANSYTASLASLNTNIAGAYQGSLPSLTYGPPDLQTAHSQSSGSVSETNINSISEEDKQQAEVTGKALASNFGSDSELVKSQSLDLNNIPLQGALGSYTLQIQSADGVRGATGIPHDQVLSDGLLQSILNAIEQPQQNTAAILSQPLIHLQQIPPQVPTNYITGFHQDVSTNLDQSIEDSQAQNSVTKNIVVTPPPLQTTVVVTNNAPPEQTATEQSVGETELNLPLVDNNEIALYFSNKGEFVIPDVKNSNNNNEPKIKEVQDDVLNGQQYGSYVSFKTPNTSFVYRNSEDSTVAQKGKTTNKKT